jgi:hypothetical protein
VVQIDREDVMITGKIRIADKYIELAIVYLDQINEAKWALGDLLVALVDTYDGRRIEVLRYMASQCNVSCGRLDEYERASRRWLEPERFDNLDWSIYRMARPEEHKELVEKAADEGWNTTTFREAVYPALIDPGNVLRKCRGTVERMVQSSKLKKPVLERVMLLIDMLDDLIGELDE